jgi:hypothetical protein
MGEIVLADLLLLVYRDTARAHVDEQKQSTDDSYMIS